MESYFLSRRKSWRRYVKLSQEVRLTTSVGNLAQPLSKSGGWDGKEAAWVLYLTITLTSHQLCQGAAKHSPANSFTRFSFLPPALIATCRTAYSSVRVASSGAFCLLSKGDGPESFPTKLQNDARRSEASVTGVSTWGRCFHMCGNHLRLLPHHLPLGEVRLE